MNSITQVTQKWFHDNWSDDVLSATILIVT